MRKALFLALFCVSTFTSKADFAQEKNRNKSPKWSSRLEFGLGLTKSWAYSTQYDVYGFSDFPLQKVLVDALVHRTSNWGFSAFMGYSFPIMSLSQNNELSLYTGLRMQNNHYAYKYIPISEPYEMHSVWDESYMTIGLPIGFDVNFNQIAKLSNKTVFATLGIGVMPNITFYSFNTTESNWSVNPYVKGEIGMKVGIPLKLQVQYLLFNHKISTMNPSYLEMTGGNYKGILETDNLYNRSSLTISIVALPFSN